MIVAPGCPERAPDVGCEPPVDPPADPRVPSADALHTDAAPTLRNCGMQLA